MKKIVAIFLCVLLLVPTTLVAYAGGGIWPDQQLTYKDANTRTEKPPVGPDGVIGFMLYDNSNTIVFDDEPRDGSIQRLAYYTNSGDHDWYLSQMYWDGLNGAFAFRPWNTTTPASGNCYLQWDLGYRMKLDQIELYYLNTADGNALFAPPKSVKFAYSDDGEVWTEVTAADYDLTNVETIKKYYDDATAKAMVDAYKQWLLYRSDPENNSALTSEQTALLTKSVVYPLGFNARYLRYYPLANGQQAYMDEGGTYINIKFVKMYDFSIPWEGSGTQEDPYIIDSLRTMNDLSRWARGGYDTTDKYFSLETDLNLSGANWTPFDFAGTIDGNNHTIAGLTQGTANDARSGSDFGGLVKDNSGTIKNLRMKNVSIYLNNRNSDSRLGAIVARNYGTIENCYVEDSVISLSSTGVGGGIAGSNFGTIKNCYIVRSQVDNSRPGGIVGDNEDGVVENCYTYDMIHIGYGPWGNSTRTNSMGSIIAAGSASVVNCYHNNEDSIFSVGPNGSGEKKSDEEFANGTVTALLNNGDSVWVQGSEYPELASFAGIINNIVAEEEAALVNITADSYVKVLNSEATSMKIAGINVEADETVTYDVKGTTVTANVWKTENGATYVFAPYIVYNADATGDIAINNLIITAFEDTDALGATGEVLANGATGLVANNGKVVAYLDEGQSIFFVVDDSLAGKDIYLTLTGADGVPKYKVVAVESYDGKNGVDFAPAIEVADYTLKLTVPATDSVQYDVSIKVGSFWTGSGTEVDPFVISTPHDLKILGEYDTTDEAYKDVYFKLSADINMNNGELTPVRRFYGSLDGDGHIVSNVVIGTEENRSTKEQNGIIGYNYGTVKNLGVENITLHTGAADGDPRTGAIAGVNSGTITSCYVKNVYIDNTTTSIAGGLVGSADSTSVISDCYVAGGSIKSSRSGGLVPDNYGTISNCFTYGLDFIGFEGAYFNTNNHKSVVCEQKGSVSNCYYCNTLNIGDNAGATAQATEQFADGTVLATLNGEEGTAWVQGAEYPVLAIFAEEAETAITSAAVADGNVTVAYSISPEITSGKAMIAVYNGDYMVAVKTVALDGTSDTLAADEATLVELFVFENLTNLMPLCNAAKYQIK